MRKFAFTLVPLLLLACSERPATAPAVEQTPAFNFMNNPDVGNLRVVRYGTDFAVSWTDPTTGLRATHTNFPIFFQGAPETDCGPQELLDPLDGQDIGLADFNDFLASWLRSHITGEVWIFVRDLNQAGDCYGRALVAEGMGTLRYTDNDGLAWYPVFATGEPSLRNNNNAYGYMASGRLTTVDGKVRNYAGHLRIVWDPQNSWYDPATGESFTNTLSTTAQVNLR